MSIKKGQIISSEKYGWTRKITKISKVDDEIEIRNLDENDLRTYTFILSNTLKSLELGIYKIE